MTEAGGRGGGGVFNYGALSESVGGAFGRLTPASHVRRTKSLGLRQLRGTILQKKSGKKVQRKVHA